MGLSQERSLFTVRPFIELRASFIISNVSVAPKKPSKTLALFFLGINGKHDRSASGVGHAGDHLCNASSEQHNQVIAAVSRSRVMAASMSYFTIELCRVS